MLAEFDEGGFFERVLIAFPFAPKSAVVQMSDRVFVQDLGTDWLPFCGRSRWLRRLAAPLHVLRTVALLVHSIRRDRLNVVRATDPCFSGLIGWAAARLTGCHFCVSIHADFDERYRLGGSSAGATIFGSRRAARSVESFVLRRAEMVMPIRESLRPYVLRLGARADRIRIIPHGTDLRAFVTPSPYDLRGQFDIPAGIKIISFVGRLSRENYVDDAIQLARCLAAMRDDFAIVIAGGGIEEARITELVRSDHVLQRVVRLVGFQERSIVAVLRQSSAVSLCLMGGFSLIEACAAGSPVVAYDVEWHAELVRDGVTGFLVREHDIVALTANVNRLLDDPGFAASLGKSARDLALSRHDLASTTKIKRKCYSDLVAGQRS